MKIHREFLQYSDAWWAIRRGMPTASEFDRIITPANGDFSKSATGYACQLIADMYSPSYGPSDDYVSAAMKNGTDTEPEARRMYEFDRGVKVQEVGFCVSDCGRFGCSPDALVGAGGVVEIKCPEPQTQVMYVIEGGLPQKYKPQVHGHLVVTGRSWCDFVSYSPNLPELIVRVVPDDYTKKLRDALDQFDALMKKLIEQLGLGEPPPNPQDEPYELPAMLTQ